MDNKDEFRNETENINESIQKAENIVLPESLSGESISKLLSDKEPLRVTSKRTVYRRIIASAAVFAILFTVLFSVKPWEKPTHITAASTSQKTSGLVEVPGSPESYEQLEKMFLSYQKRDFSLKNFFSNNVLTYDKASGAAPEAGMNGSINEDIVSGSASDGGLGSDSQYGKTNEQVAGVNEADIVKNDGTYIYMTISRNNYAYYEKYQDTSAPSNDTSSSIIAILKPSADGKTEPVGFIIAEADKGIQCQSIINMYVKGNELIAIYETYDNSANNNSTLVISFDITDRASPVERWRFYQSGAHISTRLIGDNLILMTNHYVNMYDSSDTVKKNCIPETGTNYEGCTRIPTQNICVMDNLSSPSYLVVSNISLKDADAKPASAAVLGGGSNAYCTTEKLYITNSEWDQSFVDTARKEIAAIGVVPADNTKTTVYSFDIREGNVIYKAKTSVSGTALNQFSIDEYNGALRIATTTGSFTAANNFVYILSSDSLETLGTLKDIAKGESIKSVRFTGNRGYVVTFLQTDPLFVIDLSDTANPEILGELKIPGFSAYLHPITDTLLAGIGVDGTDEGANGSLKVSLFDVSDPSKPVEADKAVFGNAAAYASSAAYYDHKAICYDEQNKTLYFPIEINNYMSRTGGCNIVTGVIGLRINAGEKSFGSSNEYYVNLNENEYSAVRRTTYIGNTVFALSENCVYSFDMATGKVLDTLSFYGYNFPKSTTPRPNKPAETTTQTDATQTTAVSEVSTTNAVSEPASDTTVIIMTETAVAPTYIVPSSSVSTENN